MNVLKDHRYVSGITSKSNFISKHERMKIELEKRGFNLSHGKGKFKKRKKKK